MARLHFTRQVHCTKHNEEVTEEDSRKIDEKDSTLSPYQDIGGNVRVFEMEPLQVGHGCEVL